jgi:hypothetical protein
MPSRSRWQDGRRAWARLNGWHQPEPTAVPGHGDNALAALKALEDIRFVRALLDTAERNAVRTARDHGESWSNVASALGVSRQSAWERWRDDVV